ncbi:MAG: CDP-alcohol phosphatidyltransferase family protein [Proteobacteria bacterium]|nr:CDP-alcohol phosphatidyltransferase family protein [Pseudomonadota bacterium]
MLYLQKGNFQKITRWMAGQWMSANQATFFGCICIVLVSLSFYVGLTNGKFRWTLLLVPLFLILRLMMNTLDGMLAREYKTGSVFGEICNEGLDIIGDNICYGILFFVPDISKVPVVLFIILTWSAEYWGVFGNSMPGGVRRHETFLGGKPDRAVWMGLMALVLYFKPDLIEFAGYYISGVCFFVFMTSVIRIKKIISDSKGKKYESYTWIGR